MSATLDVEKQINRQMLSSIIDLMTRSLPKLMVQKFNTWNRFFLMAINPVKGAKDIVLGHVQPGHPEYNEELNGWLVLILLAGTQFQDPHGVRYLFTGATFEGCWTSYELYRILRDNR